jgi:pimeloyl-ACP methyl ester carboxylesterase
MATPATDSGVAQGSGVRLAYEVFGDSGGRPLLLVMGLGAPGIAWRAELCKLLNDRGFFVIRYDNRDVGQSTHLHDAPVPNLMAAALSGDVSSAAYTLSDMADDGFAVLDALGIASSHVMGISLGGMIAQTMAVRHPERVRSMTSISSTPSPGRAAPTPQAQSALMQPPPTTREAAIDRAVELAGVIGSPDYPQDEAWTRELSGRMWDLDADPLGAMRQTMAIYASGDRTAVVRTISVPTLVIHGDRDPLVDVSAGKFTAEIIDGAALLILAGVGHDLPQPVWPAVADAVVAIADRGERGPPAGG